MTEPQIAQFDELSVLQAATLGEYEVLGELGRGGMAAVYLAHEIALDRKVAIKVISSHLGAADDLIERFRREARTAASLSHPNIIPIYAVRDSEQLLYFVMKLVDGRPLDSVIREAGALPVATVQNIFAQVGGAVGYAHRRGVVHRDLKPGNILVDDEGWCIVTDFGIAKVAESVGLTTSGMMVGTPSYMSPEQCLDKAVGPASDQYALGVVMYELLTGKLPFPGASMMSVMYAHVHTPPPPVEELRPDCPADIAAAVMRMLEKEPEKRWPSLEAAVAVIGVGSASQDENSRSQLSTLAKSGTRPLSVRHSTPRSPVPLGRTPLPSASSSAATVRTNPPLAPAAPPAKSSQVPLILAILGAAIVLAVAIVRGKGGDAAPATVTVAPAPAPVGGTADTGVKPTVIEPAAPVPAPTTTKVAAAPPPADAKAVTTDKGSKSARGDRNARQDAKGGGQPGTQAAAPATSESTKSLETAVAVVSMEEPEGGNDAPIRDLSSGGALLNAASGQPAGTNAETRRAIERAVETYASALAAGDAAAAQAAWPAMPGIRRANIEQEFANGLRYSSRWRVTELKLS
ncbi:MAG TPA: protein kinase, partial [Gemmatimonadales bacterium]|nr:protein kinase [Gemmatimonadales bacterium]